MTVLGVLGVPDSSIIANHKCFPLSAWNVEDMCELDLLLVKVFIIQSLARFFLLNQVKEVDVPVKTTRDEAHIVIVPVNASDLLYMTLTEVVRWTLTSVEVIYLDSVVANSCSKQVATIAKSDFSTVLNL